MHWYSHSAESFCYSLPHETLPKRLMFVLGFDDIVCLSLLTPSSYCGFTSGHLQIKLMGQEDLLCCQDEIKFSQKFAGSMLQFSITQLIGWKPLSWFFLVPVLIEVVLAHVNTTSMPYVLERFCKTVCQICKWSCKLRLFDCTNKCFSTNKCYIFTMFCSMKAIFTGYVMCKDLKQWSIAENCSYQLWLFSVNIITGLLGLLYSIVLHDVYLLV